MRMCGRMRKISVCVFLGVLIGIIPPLLSAQQNQNTQKLISEIEDLKQRVLELEKQLQIVENVEKLDLQAKLAEANAKLAGAQFGKYERELRDSNDDWLRNWGIFAFTVLAVVGASALAWVKSRTNQLIADAVEKNLGGFKEAVDEQEVIKNQLTVLEKEYAASTLGSYLSVRLDKEEFHPEEIKVLRDETLVPIFGDERYDLRFRYKTAEVLAARRSPRLVSPLLDILNTVVDSDSDVDFQSQDSLRGFMNCLGYIHTQECYEGLTEFLNRLLTENPKHKMLFLTDAVFSLALVSLKLNLGNSVSMLRLAVPQLDVGQHNQQALMNLARQFDIFNEPEGIKEMLTSHGTSLPSEVIDKCLELLQKHDQVYVEKWRTQNAQDNAESS